MTVSLSDVRERFAALPDALAQSLETRLELPKDLCTQTEHFDVVGVGASEASARLLVATLSAAGISSRYVPISAFLSRRKREQPALSRACLVTFSQGLSPNAQIALRQSESYAHSVLFTAVDMAAVGTAATPRVRQSLLGAVRGVVVPHLPAQESGTLLRLMGPMCATLMALRFAERLLQIRRGYAPFWATDLARVPERYRECSAPSGQLAGARQAKVGACLAVGFDAELARSLMWKWQEALYTPLPPAVDVLAFAHGPLQALYDSECMIVTLGRVGDDASEDLWSRLKKSLHPERHQVVELQAELPGPLSLFEFDAGMNAILLGEMQSRGIDPGRWPGQSTDEPLYSISRAQSVPPDGALSEDKKA